MLCSRIVGGLDLPGDSGIVDGAENHSVTNCFIRIKYCCGAANKAVDGGWAGA
jgi:hypothetical protein